mmetsp:Transcript_18509/g.45426  ORF Transcript_18509/g.45426 Transcript_18509/m.45426 type:complete len:914 (-) Transcript_18509:109-2850(-)
MGDKKSAAADLGSVNAIFESLGEHKHDYASVNGSGDLKLLLRREKEELLFSCRCIKLKKKMFTTLRQERILVLTNKAIYNFRPSDQLKAYRWRLDFYDIAGMVVSKESDECVIQRMSNKEGYRFAIESCLHAFVETLANSFKFANEIDLPLEITDEKDLEKYVRQARQITIASPSASAVNMRASAQGRRPSLSTRSSIAEQILGTAIWRSQQTEGGGRQGWLTKRKGNQDMWDAKYVVLTKESLRYFTPKQKGTFLLKGCRAMARSSSLEFQNCRSEMQLPLVLYEPGDPRMPEKKESKRSLSTVPHPKRLENGVGDSKAGAKRGALTAKARVSREPATAAFDRRTTVSSGNSTPMSQSTSVSQASKLNRTDTGDSRPDTSTSESEGRERNKIWPFYITTPQRTRTVEVASGSYNDLQRWLAAFSLVGKGGSLPKNTLVDGWLWKKNPQENSKDNWRKRYFIIHGDKCSYYEMAEKGCLILAEGVSCSKTKVVRPTRRELIADIPSETQFSYRFNVNDAGRYYPFAADTRKDMDDWIMSVNKLGKEQSRRSGSVVKEKFWKSLKEKAPEGTVTIVFSEVHGVSNLWNEVDNAAMGKAIDLHDATLRELLKKFRGYEVKTEGTTFMVAFFTAWEALSWCLAVQEALVAASWPEELLNAKESKVESSKTGKPLFKGMRVAMGMQVGKPEGKRAPTTGRMDYFGPCVNKSSRVASAAHGGQILITDDVLNSINLERKKDSKILPGEPFTMDDKGYHGLKGINTPTHIFEVLPNSLADRNCFFGDLHSLGIQKVTASLEEAGTGDRESKITGSGLKTRGNVPVIFEESISPQSSGLVGAVSPPPIPHTPNTNTVSKSKDMRGPEDLKEHDLPPPLPDRIESKPPPLPSRSENSIVPPVPPQSSQLDVNVPPAPGDEV